MKKISLFLTLCVTATLAMAFTLQNTKPYRCMIQLTNYQGEGAYVIASLIDKDGKYIKTLQVFGDDPEWYEDLTQWWSYYEPNQYNIDAITGASITGGQRAMKVFSIDDEFIDKGYKILFETAVEDQNYVPDDVVFDLTSENLKGKKVEGKGYIRYVRILDKK